MKCSYCGQDILDNAAFCSHCGAPQQGIAPVQYSQTAPAPAARMSMFALGGLVAGIIGVLLMCAFLPLGTIACLVGLTLSILGLIEVRKQPGMQGKEMAIIGIILGALGVFLTILALVALGGLVLMGPRINEIFERIYSSLQ